MPTIKDVAKLSLTSVGTVSRYLNGFIIKQTNREKIEAAIKELNFTINPIARGLKTNKTCTVGVIIPQLSNIFSTHVIEGMEQTFDEYGYSILVCDSRNSIGKEIEKLKFLKNKLVDGIIIMPVSDEGEHIQQLLDENFPVVLIDRLIKDLKCDGVVSDNVNGAYNAIESIIKLGHRKIGIISGPKNIFTAEQRLKGYLEALKYFNIEVDKSLISYSDYTREGGTTSFGELLDLRNPPTAIFASNYETTIGAIKSSIKRGLTIGEDISLFGYDQMELTQIVNPPISVVVQTMDAIGRRSAEILINRMKGDYTDFPEIIQLKTEIVVTRSIKKLTSKHS